MSAPWRYPMTTDELEPDFPLVEGLKFIEKDENPPKGMVKSTEYCWDIVSDRSYGIAFDPNKVSIIGWSIYDFGPLPEGLQYLCNTGLGGYDLYHKAV